MKAGKSASEHVLFIYFLVKSLILMRQENSNQTMQINPGKWRLRLFFFWFLKERVK